MVETPIKILLVDDHAVVRSGLKAFLQSFDGMELLGEASDGEEALRLCEFMQPDLILMDMIMPNMDGITATRAIKNRWPEIKVIALTSFDERELVRGALQAGAIGYLLKNISAEELAKAIRTAAAGRSILSPEATQALINDVKTADTETYDLTEREHEILSLMAQGATNNEISEQLVLSTSTVKFHVSNILSKLGASTRTEAVALAMKYKLTT